MLTTEFFQNIILLFLTVGSTGLLAPYVLQRIEERRHREQKLFEAELARQGKVIDAQASLLDELSGLLWKFQLSAIDVSYYHLNAASDQSLRDRAIRKYEENAGETLAQIRAEISKSLRLTSPSLYEALKSLYYSDLLDADLRLRNLVEGKNSDWLNFNGYMVYTLSIKVDDTLDLLARELRLKGDL